MRRPNTAARLVRRGGRGVGPPPDGGAGLGSPGRCRPHSTSLATLGRLSEGDIGLENLIRLRHLAEDPRLGPPGERGARRCSVSASTTHECLVLPLVTAAGRGAYARRAGGDAPGRGSVSDRPAEGDVPVEMV